MRLSDGREFYAKTVISNATRWDTFGWFLLEALKLFRRLVSKMIFGAPSYPVSLGFVRKTAVTFNFMFIQESC